jgi:hypothetical protein
VSYSVSITQAQLYVLMQAFVQAVTGLAEDLVIQGLPNRAAMPEASPGFVSMTITHTPRLRTNVDTWDTTSDDPATIELEQGTQVRMQLDCYGAASGDWAVMLSTVFRDSVGVAQFIPTCAPLYTEDPILAPLSDSEEQYESRWIVGAILQYNPITTAPQQFMDAAAVDLVDVDVAYPP